MGTEESTWSGVFEALSDTTRREVLLALRDENPRGLAELTRVIGGPGVAPARMRVSLVHNHVPRLVEGGYVVWDREADRLWRGPDWPALEPVLDVVADEWVGAPRGPA